MALVLEKENEQQLVALGLRGFAWTNRWSLCWICGKGTHIRKSFPDSYDRWVCLQCTVLWTTYPDRRDWHKREIKAKYGRRRKAA